MDIEHLRDFCLALDGVEEKTPFGKFAMRYDGILVFYVCGHMFCMTDMENYTGVTIKLPPERVAELHETRSACSVPINLSERHWIQLNFGGDIHRDEILQMVRQSYEIVKRLYSRKSKNKH